MRDLNTTQIADLLGVSKRAVVKYFNQQKIVGYKIGGRWRATTQAIYEFLEKSNEKILGGNEQ